MDSLCIKLFGKFQIQCSGRVVTGFESSKVRELLSYLLLYPNKPHHRELLADLLWPDNSAEQARSYLRRVLWQLQVAINGNLEFERCLSFQVNDNWIQLDVLPLLRLDTAVVESAYELVRDRPGHRLDENQVWRLEQAIECYDGYLLEGWYQTWCLSERERLHFCYLCLLDKVMEYCISQHNFETGLVYGLLSLKHDPAREYTHRQQMRLYYLADDRTAALRQYHKCVETLRSELGVEPAESTQQLYRQLCKREPQLDLSPPIPRENGSYKTETSSLASVLQDIENIQTQTNHILENLQDEILAVKSILKNKTAN